MAKAIRTNVVLPTDLIEAIDTVAGKGRRSDFLVEAAREKLARMKFATTAEKVAGVLDSDTYPEFSSPDGAAKFIRCLREANDLRYPAKDQDDD